MPTRGASLYFEDVNSEVDDVLRDEELTRVLARVEITFSNSMIGAFLRFPKHSWPFLHSLDSFTALGRLVELYVTAHNQVMPHSAFEGQTPDEMFSRTGGSVVAEPATARKAAREERVEEDRAAACSECFVEADSSASLLQRPRSRMS